MYKRLNITLVLTMLICSLFLSFYDCINFSRFLTYICLCFLIIIPFTLYKTKYMPPSKSLFIYYMYIFLADYLGCICHLYDMITYYDLLMHFLSGIILFKIALKLLKLQNLKIPPIETLIFAIIFSMALSTIWEIFEFSSDVLLLTDMQKNLIYGVNDTMEDLIVSLIGSLSILEYKIFKLESSNFN